MSGRLDDVTRRRVVADLLSTETGPAGAVVVSVDGGCMAPHFRAGDRLRVTRGARLWPGDVMVYRRADDALVAHRFLGLRPSRRGLTELVALAKADAAERADCAVPIERVVGRAEVPISIRSRVRALADLAMALVHDAQRLSRTRAA